MYTALRTQIEKFVSLNDGDWEFLLPHLRVIKLKKHELFSEIGKVADEVGLVTNGMMRHYYMNEGEEKTTYFYFENHLVASYISCITKQPSQLTIQALSDCELIVFPYPVLVQLYDKSPAWQKFGRVLAEYLAIGLEERMVELLILSPEERYLKLISGNKTKIIERIPQHYVASYLGLTPVSLRRIRNRVLKK